MNKTKNMPNLIGTIVLLIGLMLLIVLIFLGKSGFFEDSRRITYEETGDNWKMEQVVDNSWILILIIFPIVMACGFFLLSIDKNMIRNTTVEKFSTILAIVCSILGIISYICQYTASSPIYLMFLETVGLYTILVLGIIVVVRFSISSLKH